jgi:hypothetical protein
MTVGHGREKVQVQHVCVWTCRCVRVTVLIYYKGTIHYKGLNITVIPCGACGSYIHPSKSHWSSIQVLYPSSICGPALSCCITTTAPSQGPPSSTSRAIAGINVYSHSRFKGKRGLVAVPTSVPVTAQSTRYGTPLVFFTALPLKTNLPCGRIPRRMIRVP